MSQQKLRVGINAQIIPSEYGGVEQFIIGLVHALGRLGEEAEEYIIVTHPYNPNWLQPYISDNMHIVPRSWRGKQEQFRFALSRSPLRKQIIRPVFSPVLKYLIRQLNERISSDGFFESLSLDVIHFPMQNFVVTKIPSIYNPHDLQHLHLPQYFTKSVIDFRETVYRAGCNNANAIGVASTWIKQDIIQHYNINPNKIFVIPLGPPTETYQKPTNESLTAIKAKFRILNDFALYPAQTWPHKNHIRLLEAIALLREQNGVRIDLVCTGRKNDFWPQISKRVAELNLNDQVRFLGFIDPMDLRLLYRLAKFVIIPTLFEAGSFPMLEAWYEGSPVACSTVTSLPHQAGDAALLFDPTSVESIAGAIYRMATDDNLRETLKERGAKRIQFFTWERTAKMYRALYRMIGGQGLTDEDKTLLDEAISV